MFTTTEFTTSLKIAPSNPNTLYVAGIDFFYVSEDGGNNWQMRPLPFPNTAGSGTLAVHPLMPNVILAHIVDYGAGGGILKSLDGGSSWGWAFVFGPADCYAIEFDSANPNIIYAGGSSSSARQSEGVYKSTDGGMNWSFFSISKSTTNIIRALAIDPVNAANLYAGTDDGGVYKSNDGGRKWKAFNSGLTNLSVSELAFDLSGRFLHAATEAGVFSVRVREDSPTSASATISGTIADGTGASPENPYNYRK